MSKASATYAFFLAISLLLFVTSAAAQQNCASRKEEGTSQSITYTLDAKQVAARREVTLQCTEEDDVVKVTLKNKVTGRVLQSFQVRQMQTYLEASTPDLDADGYADLALVTSWGSPNATFQAWRYDPVRDRLTFVIESIGTEFVRMRSGEIVAYAKGGADVWSYTIFRWSENRLIPAYTIEERIDATTQCIYRDASIPRRNAQIKDGRRLKHLRNYCGIGGSGLLENANNLLKR